MSQDGAVIAIRESGSAAAAVGRMFPLATSVPLVQRTLGFTPVEGETQGHIVMNSRVLWKGWLFGLPQYHLTRITGYAEPKRDKAGVEYAFFQDSQEKGRFAYFQHDHHFTGTPDGGTLMEDEVRFRLPFGVLGRMVARLIMEPHIRKLMRSRFALLAQVAATEEWRKYVPASMAVPDRMPEVQTAR